MTDQQQIPIQFLLREARRPTRPFVIDRALCPLFNRLLNAQGHCLWITHLDPQSMVVQIRIESLPEPQPKETDNAK